MLDHETFKFRDLCYGQSEAKFGTPPNNIVGFLRPFFTHQINHLRLGKATSEVAAQREPSRSPDQE